MKKLLLILTTYSLSLTTIYAQTADGIIAKHLGAMGGLKKMQAIKTVYMEGTTEAGKANGGTVPVKYWLETKKALRIEIDMQPTPGYFIITQDSGWIFNPLETEKNRLKAMTVAQLKALHVMLDQEGSLINHAAYGYKATYLGKEGPAYKIEEKMGDSLSTTFYIDTATHYLWGTITNLTLKGKKTNIQCPVQEFKKTPDGYVFPMATDWNFVGSTVKYTSVKVNEPMDKSLFEPKR